MIFHYQNRCRHFREGQGSAVFGTPNTHNNRLSILKIKSILKNSALNIDRGPSIPNTALAGRKVGMEISAGCNWLYKNDLADLFVSATFCSAISGYLINIREGR